MPPLHHRRSIRLRGYDYRDSGAYVVTICTRHRDHLFGRIDSGRMWLNAEGCIAHSCWQDLPRHFPFVSLDAFVVMPNHVHGIVRINDHINHGRDTFFRRGAACYAPTINNDGAPTTNNDDAPTNNDGAPVTSADIERHMPPQSIGPLAHSLGAIIRSYKSAVTRHINLFRDAPGAPIWQRNYHERIIRDASEHHRIRQYILDNPFNWTMSDDYDGKTSHYHDDYS